MSTKCAWPTCNSSATHGQYCFMHGKVYGSTKPDKTPVPVKTKSETRKEEDKEYKKIVIAMFAESKDCEIKSPVCTKIAQGLHHMKKRSPSTLLDKRFLKRACNRCNHYIEERPGWAKENGHSVSKFQ